jgi:hypothetical protein
MGIKPGEAKNPSSLFGYKSTGFFASPLIKKMNNHKVANATF